MTATKNAEPQLQQAVSKPDTIAIALVDDNRLLREGIAAMLRLRPEYRVVRSSATVDDVLHLMAQDSPEVLLLDLGLVDEDSLEAAARLRDAAPSLRVILMGLSAAHDDVAAYVRAGVSGFIMKEATFDEFVSTIDAVASGLQVLPRALTHSLFSQIIRDEVVADRQIIDEGVHLTTRERQIIDLLGQGMSNKDIANQLHIAIHTVKSHVHNILEKLSLRSRLEVAAYAYGTGRQRDRA
jgi:two-component system nitrate/nitrite response regulator NarL